MHESFYAFVGVHSNLLFLYYDTFGRHLIAVLCPVTGCDEVKLEARVGIEPASTALQAAA